MVIISRNIKQSLAVLITLFIFQGCSTIPYDSGTPFSDGDLTNSLKKRVETLYPDRFVAIHRCVLEVADRNFILNGYVSVNRADSWFCLVAQGGMGGTFFKISKTGDHSVQILKQNPLFKKTWIEDAAARDVSSFYLKLPSDDAELVSHGPDSVGLISRLNGGSTEEFLFELNAGTSNEIRLKSYIVAHGETCVYRADFLYDQTVPGGGPDVPGTILINDYKLNYMMRVTVVKIKPSGLMTE